MARGGGGLTLEDLRARRDEILRIAAKHGAHNVRVFGLVARGQARPDSDIDFVVEFDPERTVLDLRGRPMASTNQRSELDEQRLIEQHIDASWGRADARLKRAGVSVWSLIGYLRAFEGDLERTQGAFELSAEELEAALAYYRRNQQYIDARLLLNTA